MRRTTMNNLTKSSKKKNNLEAEQKLKIRLIDNQIHSASSLLVIMSSILYLF